MQEVRQLFVEPEVMTAESIGSLVWKAPDEDALVAWLVHEKQFSEERVRSAIAKMVAAKGKATQNRMESFFQARRLLLICYNPLRFSELLAAQEAAVCTATL